MAFCLAPSSPYLLTLNERTRRLPLVFFQIAIHWACWTMRSPRLLVLMLPQTPTVPNHIIHPDNSASLWSRHATAATSSRSACRGFSSLMAPRVTPQCASALAWRPTRPGGACHWAQSETPVGPTLPAQSFRPRPTRHALARLAKHGVQRHQPYLTDALAGVRMRTYAGKASRACSRSQ